MEAGAGDEKKGAPTLDRDRRDVKGSVFQANLCLFQQVLYQRH
jgi:hypothetical protein